MLRKIIALVTAAFMLTMFPALAAPVNPLPSFKTIPADQDIAVGEELIQPGSATRIRIWLSGKVWSSGRSR